MDRNSHLEVYAILMDMCDDEVRLEICKDLTVMDNISASYQKVLDNPQKYLADLAIEISRSRQWIS